MAKNPKGGGRGKRAAKSAGEAAPEQRTLRVPAKEQVVNLVRRLKGLKKRAQEAAGEMGEAVASAVETKHFDRKALSMVRQLEGMSDEKLAITLPHLMKYIDDLGLEERASKQAEMFDAGDDEAGTPPGERDVRRGRGGAPRLVDSTFKPVGDVAANIG